MVDKSKFVGRIAITSEIDLRTGEIVDLLIDQETKLMFDDLFEDDTMYNSYTSWLTTGTDPNEDLFLDIEKALYLRVYIAYIEIRDVRDMPAGKGKAEIQNFRLVDAESHDTAYRTYAILFNDLLDDERTSGTCINLPNRFGI